MLDVALLLMMRIPKWETCFPILHVYIARGSNTNTNRPIVGQADGGILFRTSVIAPRFPSRVVRRMMVLYLYSR